MSDDTVNADLEKFDTIIEEFGEETFLKALVFHFN